MWPEGQSQETILRSEFHCVLGSCLKFIVDQTSEGIAKDLRNHGYECETATKLILGHEDSRQRVSDYKIMRFLEEHRNEYTLLTSDVGLAKDCVEEGLPVRRLPNPLPTSEEILGLVAPDERKG